ncbi:ATP synthase F0 subunit 6 (mitochondrion) [Cherax quadricarinatus]|uniref:ATP synthase subunit a n=1 Tax=Cherax quadricarinatus TaxID=27406 RepID=V5LX44_CHEQU|nr:ATP synthase F0 subunit 6 [Cherax quadricarinatus]AHA59383.1 ATP synthase F0 subunit 6 [Cherax quadricarinatus]QXU57603.1 ATP synthase F0 subunit 6 [Cherax quadricarinatus]QXU57616.1 ATP synthase F0 subunit 6 [Cherax quadricarinatus]QXU57707.1 ATP synthase F0 subunit 6 [Cherax quadricarinatus]
MMASLFSIFEPSSCILSLNLNWVSTFLGFLFVPILFWTSPSRWLYLWFKIVSTLHNEFKTILGPSNPGLSFLFVSLFSFILFNNSLGLLPYIFTSSSHLAMTLTLALPLWLTFILFGWLNHTQHMFAHLVPQGTPNTLMPFMVLIETISNIIRPGTLAIRLAANMIAGHLLLTLLGSMGSSLSPKLLIFLILAQILLLMLESAVAIIQSYVFAVLSTLYASEVN